MAQKTLRAVTEADVAEPVKPSTITAAAEVSERALLVSLRDKLAGDLDKGVPPHALKGIVSELREIDRDIRALDRHANDDDSVVVKTGNDGWDASAI